MDMTRWVMLNPKADDFNEQLRSYAPEGLPMIPVVVMLSESEWSECVVWGIDGSVRTWNRQKWMHGEFE